MSKGIFGNMFDFNGDGDLNIFEKGAELAFLHAMMEEADKEDGAEDTDASSDISLSFQRGSGDSETDEDWRCQYYGDEIGIDPDGFDSEDEYLEAVQEKQDWIDDISDNLSNLANELFIYPEDYDSYDEFVDAVKDAM